MTNQAAALGRAKRRRLIAVALLRSLAAAVVLVALYYLLPLDRLTGVPLGVLLAIGLVVLLAVSAWQVRTIISAKYPAVRAIEALATTVPLFLLLFAAAYFVMAKTSPASFSGHLTRTDAFYFTVTIFSTVGFGDITAVSESARLVVTAQMILDLLILGLGIRVFIGAVQRGRQRAQPDSADPGSPPE
jgi:signal transduction histidine kinase